MLELVAGLSAVAMLVWQWWVIYDLETQTESQIEMIISMAQELVDLGSPNVSVYNDKT